MTTTLMAWVLIVHLYSAGPLGAVYFATREACEAARVWLQWFGGERPYRIDATEAGDPPRGEWT